jgi:chromosome segregation and condensation protein ScpB
MWITIRATPDLKAVAEEIAKIRGKNTSDTVREILMEEAVRAGIRSEGASA